MSRRSGDGVRRAAPALLAALGLVSAAVLLPAAAPVRAQTIEPMPVADERHGQAAAAVPSAAPSEAAAAVPPLVLQPSDWLIERDAAGTLLLQPVVPGTRLRDLSRPGWRIESDLVSGALFAVPTRPGSGERDERRDAVALAANAAAQLALVAPPATGGAIVLGRTLGHPVGQPVGHPVGHPASQRPVHRPGHPGVPASGRLSTTPPAQPPGFVVPPTGLRPVIAPLLPGFEVR